MVFVICISAYHCSASLLLRSLNGFELFRSDQIQLGLHGQKQLLVGQLFFLLTFKLDLFALLAFSLLNGFLDFYLLL